MLIPEAGEVRLTVQEQQQGTRSESVVEASQASLGDILANLFLDGERSEAQQRQRMGYLLQLVAVPFYWVLLLVTVFALSAGLYDEAP